MMDLRLDLLSADNPAAAGALLAASHHNYPAFRVDFPDSRVRHRILVPFQTAAARDAALYGSMVGAYLDDHLAGVALWQRPGRFPLSPLRKARITPVLIHVTIAAPQAFPRFVRSGAALERAFPEQPVCTCKLSASIRTLSVAGSVRHCFTPGSPWSMPIAPPTISTPETNPMWTITGGGASNSPSLHSKLAAAGQPTTG